jgi:hypothetical protein
MAVISKSKTFADNEQLLYTDLNTLFDDVYNEFNGNIENANVDASAAIASSKISFGTDIFIRGVISLSTGDIYAGTGKDEFTIPATLPASKWVIETVEVEVDTAPGTSKTLTVDVNKAGSSILSAPISITGTAVKSTGNTPSITALSAGDRMTLDVDTATAGIATYRARVNLIIKQYLQTS